MTEEIYIDDVDVAGCEFYQIEANELYPKAQYCGSMRNTFCENEPNCYYKQLKRLEQERNDLQDRLLTLANTYQETRDVCKRLEQENKDFEILAKSLYKRIEELEKENEALAFRERLYKADYEASEQENKELGCEVEQ